MTKSKMTTVQLARAIRVALQKRNSSEISLIDEAGILKRYDAQGYDANGYDRMGVDRQGFDRTGRYTLED